MDQELDKRLRNMQAIMEANHLSLKDEIGKIYTYLSRENSNRAAEINTLRSTNQYNERVLKDFNNVKETANKYKRLYWGTICGLVGIVIIALAVKAFIL